MKNYDSVYRTYDLRSLYNDPMDENFCYTLGVRIGETLVENHWESASCVLCCDARVPNTSLMLALISWLKDWWLKDRCLLSHACEWVSGQEFPFGVASTSLMYRTAYEQFDLWIALTASHNPDGWVWMKVADRDAALLPSTYLKDLVEEYVEFPYDNDESWKASLMEECEQQIQTPDSRITQKIEDYYGSILLPIFKKVKKEYHIVVDYSWAAAAWYEKEYFERLEKETNLKITHFNDKWDGTFAQHLSDTSTVANYEKLWNLVRDHSADLGVMFDGDADRLWIVDSKWEVVLGDRIVSLISTSIIQQNPWALTVYDITCTNDIKENAEKYWGKTAVTKNWYRFVKATMKEHKAVFWWESSGHLLFPEVWYAESPLLALAYVLCYVDGYESIEHAVGEMSHWIKPPLKNYHVKDKDWAIERIKEEFKDYELNLLDWVRVDWPDRWLIARKSNSEPLLRVFVETKSQEKCSELMKQLDWIIEG